MTKDSNVNLVVLRHSEEQNKAAKSFPPLRIEPGAPGLKPSQLS